MMLVKVHEHGEFTVVAVCDKCLIGKKFEEGSLCLEISERFYDGSEVSDDDMMELVEDCRTMNIVGEESVKFFLGKGIISEKNVNKVEGIPFAIIC